MTETRYRFEWRAFAKHFGASEYRIDQHGQLKDIQNSKEWYLVSRHGGDVNIKIRGNNLDVKKLIQKQGQLEQWAPAGRLPLPVTLAAFQDTVLTPLGLQPANWPAPLPELLDEKALKDHIFYQMPDLVAVAIGKRRTRYLLDECLAELTELDINGTALRSICIESEDPDLVNTKAKLIGLDAWHNRSYVQALREIAGLIPQSPLLR